MTDSEPKPSMILLARGVIAILDAWPALRIAVEEGWGGPDAAQKQILLASEVVDSFESSAPNLPSVDDIEELLLQAIIEEFQCEIDDDSSIVIARHIVAMAKDVVEGRGENAVARLEEVANRVRRSKVQSVKQKGDADSDSDNSEESGEEIESDAENHLKDGPPANSGHGPEIDEDGFTVVRGNRRR